MKKSKIYMSFAALALPLMGCNMNIGPGSYSFRAVHIYGFDKESRDVAIKSWREWDSPGIEVNTEKYGSLFLSEGTYILLRGIGDCPICGRG